VEIRIAKNEQQQAIAASDAWVVAETFAWPSQMWVPSLPRGA